MEKEDYDRKVREILDNTFTYSTRKSRQTCTTIPHLFHGLLLLLCDVVLRSFELLRIPQARIHRLSASSVGSFQAISSILAMVSRNRNLVRTGAKLKPILSTPFWLSVRLHLGSLLPSVPALQGGCSSIFLLLLRRDSDFLTWLCLHYACVFSTVA